jgi:hypothetical protein
MRKSIKDFDEATFKNNQQQLVAGMMVADPRKREKVVAMGLASNK